MRWWGALSAAPRNNESCMLTSDFTDSEEVKKTGPQTEGLFNDFLSYLWAGVPCQTLSISSLDTWNTQIMI